MKNSKFIKSAAMILCVTTVLGACFSFVFIRANRCFSIGPDTAAIAAFMSYSNGSLFKKNQKVTENKTEKKSRSEAPEPTLNIEKTDKEKKTSSENTYPIVETNISSGNMSYENIAVKNTTGYELDIESVLNKDLPFEISDSRQVQVLIVHTHTCESYMEDDTGEYDEDFYPRTTDNEKNVCAVGEELANGLKARGIGVVHDTTRHDYPTYDGAYDRSYETIEKYLEKYKDIKVIIDLHRDSMTAQNNTKYKPVFEYNGKKAAQVMIMTGHSEDSDFSFWDENLILALKLQKKCEDMYPGMTRPLNFGDFTYNMNANNGSLLIEFGTDANTVEEAKRSGEMLANALASVLQKD